MSTNKITQETHEMVYIKHNDVVIVHVEPFTISVLSSKQAEKFGFDISKMKKYENLSINGIPKGGYELVEDDDDHRKSALNMSADLEKLINSLDID